MYWHHHSPALINSTNIYRYHHNIHPMYFIFTKKELCKNVPNISLFDTRPLNLIWIWTWNKIKYTSLSSIDNSKYKIYETETTFSSGNRNSDIWIQRIWNENCLYFIHLTEDMISNSSNHWDHILAHWRLILSSYSWWFHETLLGDHHGCERFWTPFYICDKWLGQSCEGFCNASLHRLCDWICGHSSSRKTGLHFRIFRVVQALHEKIKRNFI